MPKKLNVDRVPPSSLLQQVFNEELFRFNEDFFSTYGVLGPVYN